MYFMAHGTEAFVDGIKTCRKEAVILSPTELSAGKDKMENKRIPSGAAGLSVF